MNLNRVFSFACIEKLMSSFNVLPTAVVSPLVSPETEESQELTYAQNATATDVSCLSTNEQNDIQSNNGDCIVSKENSLISSQIGKKRKRYCKSVVNFKNSSITDCSVKLTNFKKLCSYNKNQDYFQKVQLPAKKRLNLSAKKNENVLQKKKSAEKTVNLVTKSGEKKIIHLTLKKTSKHATSIPSKGTKLLKTKKLKNKYSDNSLVPTNSDSSILKKRKKSDFKRIGRSLSSIKLGSKQSLNFAPKLVDILQEFSANVVVCSFCHLPAHFLPGLGDLYGPYRPTYNEFLEQYQSINQNFSVKQSLAEKTDFDISKQEVCIDQVKKTCYITTSGFADKDKDKDLDYSSLRSTSGSEKVVHSFMPQLRLYQAVDCVLTESGRKSAAKFSSNSKTLRIPGFTGKITTTDKSRPVHCDSNRTLLHDMNTIVFIEPTKTFSYQDSRTSMHESNSDDSTSVDVVHRFSVKPIWVHSACAVWTPGVHCIGNEVQGVATAVRRAANNVCDYCGRTGASIPCKYRKDVSYHYQCCLAEGLMLNDQTFMASNS